MKIEKILFTAFVALGVCTSCTEESLVDGGGSNNAAGTINLALTTDFIQTKAADGYTYATGDEIKINDCAVSIYQKKSDGTAGDQVGYAWANFSGTANGNYDNKEAYVFNNVTTKTGNVIILVAANTGIWTSADGLQGLTYADFKKKSVSNTATTGILFDATNLVKFGEKDTTLSANTDNVHVALSQLAARVDLKVKVTDNNSESSKWSFAMSSLKVENINTASDLFLETYNTSNYTYNSKKALGSFNASSLTSNEITFYTYEKKNNDSNLAIQLSGRLTSLVQANTYSDKTYKITLNPTVSDKVTTNGFIHGNVYDVTGNIIPSENAITFDVTVKPWTIVNIDASLKNIHYLAVKEPLAYMNNVTSYEIEFASDLDASKLNVKAVYTNYYKNSEGKIVSGPATYTNGEQFPVITVNNTTKKISITCATPTNNYPKVITFDLTNNNGLTESVKVIQYPALYMEGEVSTAADATKYYPNTGDILDDINKNPNLFTITTIAAQGYLLGVSKDANGVTKSDAESNELVSPKFIIASRRALVNSGWWTRNDAIARCKTYWEQTATTTYPAGTWRLPTIAELKLLNDMQDNNSTVGVLFNTNGQYWSAKRCFYFDFALNKPEEVFDYTSYSSTTDRDDRTISGGGIRCVHDVY